MTECYFRRTILKGSKDIKGLVELAESIVFREYSTVQGVARRISSHGSLNTTALDAGTSSLLESAFVGELYK